ncbi:MAG: helix-hairpin-helix domain-containing protein [Lachnospiraceae bacterium]|nr:helix-hairpin-helix domain-containing protein [Lachnospiraceae bacterium]
MNIKLNIILLLFCCAICLSACNASKYEIDLLSGQDISDEEQDGLAEPALAIPEAEPDLSCFVHICGAVVNPGVYEIASGSRIFEVLSLAGGFTDDAAADAVNLAMEAIDGSKIQIPTKEEMAEKMAAFEADFHDLQANFWISEKDGYLEAGASPSLTDLVNINTAPYDILMTLPGIGKAKAESIISYREEKGKFAVIEDIMKITGIKDAVFSRIKDKICVD